MLANQVLGAIRASVTTVIIYDMAVELFRESLERTITSVMAKVDPVACPLPQLHE